MGKSCRTFKLLFSSPTQVIVHTTRYYTIYYRALSASLVSVLNLDDLPRRFWKKRRATLPTTGVTTNSIIICWLVFFLSGKDPNWNQSVTVVFRSSETLSRVHTHSFTSPPRQNVNENRNLVCEHTWLQTVHQVAWEVGATLPGYLSRRQIKKRRNCEHCHNCNACLLY